MQENSYSQNTSQKSLNIILGGVHKSPFWSNPQSIRYVEELNTISTYAAKYICSQVEEHIKKNFRKIMDVTIRRILVDENSFKRPHR